MISYKPMSDKPSVRSPWFWVPSLYFAQGIPYVAVMIVSVLMYKRLGVSNTDIALYTSWLNLPWVIKPFWSPFVDLLKTKRWWIVVMQILVGAGLAGIALTIQGPLAFRYCLAFMWLLAFSSATHDIAASLTKSLTQLPRSVRCYGNGKVNFKMEQYYSILQQCGMFNGIQPRKYREVLRCLNATVREYPRGAHIVELGEQSHNTGVLLDGTIEEFLYD